MNSPIGLAFDSVNNRLFVADYGNSRVLVFNTTSITDGMNAANVLGQANFTDNTSGLHTQSELNEPQDVAYDAANNRLFVADMRNNREMVFNTASITDGMNAANVLGQTNFTNNGSATTRSRMYNPDGVVVDSSNNRQYVPDGNNYRILVYSTSSITNGMNAANVLGQTNFTDNTFGVSQSLLGGAALLSFDPVNNRLFTANYGSARVMVFNTATIPNGMNAANVLGQADFVSSGGVSTQSGLGSNDNGVYYDPGTHHVFVADTDNNRVMIFDGSYIPAADYFYP
jgi:DNA-binding beta-propeller fold protein YncE